MKLTILISFLLALSLCTAKETPKANAFKMATDFVKEGKKESASIVFLRSIEQGKRKREGSRYFIKYWTILS